MQTTLKKKKQSDVSNVVKGIMETHRSARNDDYILYGFYLNHYGISVNITYKELYHKLKKGEITSIESVGRVRRKIQELYPGLGADEHVENARRSKEPKYKEFAKRRDL